MVTLAGLFDSPRMLEVGGGRSPMLAEEDVRALGATYTVNDIDPDELARAPEWVSRLEGDIADPSLLGGEDGFDVVFANMVFEHVADPQEGYRNIVARLSPGGYLVNFVPTMYAPPFVLNKLLPEDLTSRLLLRIQPHRHVGDKPKFPAYYRWCTATSATEARLRGAGFSECEAVPFYGHSYYKKVPGLRDASAMVSRAAHKRGLRPLASYAYLVAQR